MVALLVSWLLTGSFSHAVQVTNLSPNSTVDEVHVTLKTSADGHFGFFANANTLYRRDLTSLTSTNQVIATNFYVGALIEHGLDTSADGSTVAYHTMANGKPTNEIVVLDLNQNTIQHILFTAANVPEYINIALSRDGLQLAINGNGYGFVADFLEVHDLIDQTVTSIDIKTANLAPLTLKFSKDGTQLFFCTAWDGAGVGLYIFDLNKQTLTGKQMQFSMTNIYNIRPCVIDTVNQNVFCATEDSRPDEHYDLIAVNFTNNTWRIANTAPYNEQLSDCDFVDQAQDGRYIFYNYYSPTGPVMVKKDLVTDQVKILMAPPPATSQGYLWQVSASDDGNTLLYSSDIVAQNAADYTSVFLRH